MTNGSKVTLRDIYEAINALEAKMTHRMEKVEGDVEENTTFRNQLIGKMTVIFAVIGVSVNLLWDYIFNNK